MGQRFRLKTSGCDRNRGLNRNTIENLIVDLNLARHLNCHGKGKARRLINVVGLALDVELEIAIARYGGSFLAFPSAMDHSSLVGLFRIRLASSAFHSGCA